MRYAVVIESGPENFSAYVPDLPGCIATARRWTRSSPTFVEPPSSISRACAPTVCRYRNRLLAANTLKPLRNLEPRTDPRLNSQWFSAPAPFAPPVALWERQPNHIRYSG